MGPLDRFSTFDCRNPSLPDYKSFEINKLLVSEAGAVIFLRHHTRGIIKLTLSLKPRQSITVCGEQTEEIRDLLIAKLPAFSVNH
ncbi:hypothetical protein KKF34_01940 [Myxococcota bacterium]|nr:hypothetical protein [Myxococcota bacterium]MBU1381199.1 hypothetical protein [Myxococcota bacterium]MBU1495621.1 hypothetical protein [Myxococcota bacterium]